MFMLRLGPSAFRLRNTQLAGGEAHAGIVRCALSRDKTPPESSRSCQLRRLGQQILNKSIQGEADLAVFDSFSEQSVTSDKGHTKQRKV